MKRFIAIAAIALIAAPAHSQVFDTHTIVNPDGTGFTCTFMGNTTSCEKRSAKSVKRSQQYRIDSLKRNNNCVADLGQDALGTRAMDECTGLDASHIKWLAQRKEKRCQELLSSSVIPAKRSWYKECNYN